MYIRILFLLLSFSAAAQVDSSEIEKYRANYIVETVKEFPGLQQDFYPVNQKFNVEAKYKIKKSGKVISVPTSSEKNKDFQEYAILKFKIDGKTHELTVYQPMPISPINKNYLFLPLKDLTAPIDSYGGGRYMDLNTKDFRGKKVQLDLNKLYNPFCAFSDGWSCPVPPKNNHLNLRIEAGEKLPISDQNHD